MYKRNTYVCSPLLSHPFHAGWSLHGLAVFFSTKPHGVPHPSATAFSPSQISGKKVALRAPKTQEQQEGPSGHMLGAEDITGDRGQSCSMLDLVLTENPAREEQR